MVDNEETEVVLSGAEIEIAQHTGGRRPCPEIAMSVVYKEERIDRGGCRT